jgi:hypothetical protein
MKAYQIETGYVLDIDMPKKVIITSENCTLQEFSTEGMHSCNIDSEIYSFIENTKQTDASDLCYMTYALIQHLTQEFIFGD